MSNTVKADISAKFRELEHKLGYLVFTFNSNRYMRGACTGWVDHVVINTRNSTLWMLEVKVGKDVLSARQQSVQLALVKIDGAEYRVVTENNVDKIIDEIITGGER